MSNNFGYIDIILLAMIAGFIILRLRNILGRKTGHQDKVYDGFCKKTKSKSVPNKHPAYRLQVNPKTLEFTDLIEGVQTANPGKDYGDFILIDAHGYYSYHLTNTVDDDFDGINLIIRGKDILPSTPSQLYLQQELRKKGTEKSEEPKILYYHHPLIMSKSIE